MSAIHVCVPFAIPQCAKTNLGFLRLKVDIARDAMFFAARRETHDHGALDGAFQPHILDAEHHLHAIAFVVVGAVRHHSPWRCCAGAG